MFCFETAFKLLTLSWAAYTEEEALPECEADCVLHGRTAEGGTSVVRDGECRCHSARHSCHQVMLLQSFFASQGCTNLCTTPATLLWCLFRNGRFKV